MLRRLQGSRARYAVPNGITFLSLGLGVAAILASATGALTTAGALILLSYILDLLDGEMARRLSAGSSFGLQLDSLVDMVSLGTAPAVLAFFHLRPSLDSTGLLVMLWLLTILYTIAGAFRLARFNLLPAKTGQTDSVGLTISTSGATLTLAVVSDIANNGELIPAVFFLPLLFVLGLLMVSWIPFPSLTWVFSYRRANVIYLLFFAVTLIALRLPAVTVWLLFNIGFLSAALLRALAWRNRASN
ncbi:MAG: CDP-alcohol phosphatidyltransferase family protein [Anaerolineae bacterium]|nr:CDP-alcohol phosphatidyltransferase family protein [Anaerolineae bacterium]